MDYLIADTFTDSLARLTGDEQKEDRAGLLRVARYGARAALAESRLRYDAARAEVERVSDRSAGPDAGVHRWAALEFVARRVDYVPERYTGKRQAPTWRG